MKLILPQKIRLIFVTLLLVSITNLKSQTKNYATAVPIQDRVDNANNAVDGNLLTKADINASSGILVGIGAYSGYLELQYPSNLPANTTSFTKIETQDDLLPSLLGGSLGGLLSDIAGVLLIGNQEFTVKAQNNAVTVLEKQSTEANGFSTEDLRVVVDKDNDYFLAVTPDQEYNRIRIDNSIGSLIGLNNTRQLGVYESYYTTGTGDCGLPSYTSFSGNGISLDLLNLGGAGVTNPNFAIDGDVSTFAELGLGVLDVAASIQQTIYFDADSGTDDVIYVRLAVDPSLVSLGLLNNINITASNGVQEVYSSNISSLLSLDLLGLLQNGNSTVVAFKPSASVNRVTISLASLLNVAVSQQIRLYDIYRAPEQPVFTDSSTDISICSGSTAEITATANGAAVELRWYDAETDGNLLATTNSGDTFTTPALNTSTTYYVASAYVGCTEESPRVEVPVTVMEIPTAADITVIGNENPICSQSSVVLVPSSAIDATYNWFLDSAETMPITNGMVVNGATYNIDENGVLTITGLTDVNSPYTYYVGSTDNIAGCKNVDGDLKPVAVTIVDSSNTAVDVTLDTNISLANLITIFQVNPTTDITGSVTGDVNVGDEVIVAINGTTYTGILDANLDFSIAVDGTDLLSDIDNVLEIFISGGLCSITDDVTVTIPEFILDNLNQVFCASDNATLLDLDVNGNNVVFFDSLLGSATVDANAALTDGGTYYVGLLDVPLSVLPRVQITVSILDTPAPTTTSTTQVFCEANNPVVGDIQVNETAVVFYDAETGGTMLDPSTALVDGATYYVANTENGCESSERLVITVTFTQPAPTTSSTAQEFCSTSNATLADIQINETAVVFYDAETGGTMLSSDTAIVDGTTYYVANLTSGCESEDRLAITTTIEEAEQATLTGIFEDACLEDSYMYTTETDKQNYVWTVTGGTITDGGTSTDSFVTVTWDDLNNTEITVTYDSASGCTSEEAILSVGVISCGEVLGEEFCLFVYNEFSPNNDGYNDFFKVQCLEDYSSNTLQVFNRNGNQVFETVNYSNNWDGVANVNGVLRKGDYLPSGTYYYILTIPELNRTLKGWLQIAR
ncbi:hypothetical protein A5M85_17020 [Cellulophaga lytica]|uniref:Ig-like domain-containing protein n=1 Tax=Cellulophaga lytica TaxID=979 RepID=UPI00095064E8|nr:gliding motility-associated C-terminal domain-containing protein [Cellulophaga lytica]APU11919.1 hypothetical protein A5M85_17020 [Cellulophaga lytica]